MEMITSRLVLRPVLVLGLAFAALSPLFANGELTVLAMLRPAAEPPSVPPPVTAAPPASAAPPSVRPEIGQPAAVTQAQAARFQAMFGGAMVRPPACLDIHYQRVEVQIADHAAVTRVRQQYRNTMDAVLEGEYRFRLAPEASVSDFAIWDGDTRVAGVIRRREEARAIYDSIVNQRRDPGLLEQIGENLFSARVFPILPLADKRIEIEYRESLRVEDGVTCYRYPLTTPQGQPSRVEELAVTLDIRDGAQVTAAWSPTPGVAVHHHDLHRVTVSYEARNQAPASDLLVYYTVRRPLAGMRVLSHRPDPKEPGYWMLSIAPPSDALPARAKDVVFVVDTSGSMRGAKMDQARRALKYCLTGLHREDRFNVLRFSTDVEPMSRNLVEATPKALAEASGWVGRLHPDGGTNIDGALTAALGAFPAEPVVRPRYVVFLTDGQPTVGAVDSDAIRMHARQANASQARLFTFGVDEAARLPLLSGLAADHRGESISVGAEEDVSTALPLFFGKLTVPLFEDVTLAWEGVAVASVHPAKLPHFYLGRQVSVVGRYREAAAGTVTLSARVDGRPVTYQLSLAFPAKQPLGAAIPRLWAQQEVDALIAGRAPESLPGELKDEIVRLSMLHHFATPFTSFIAVPESENARLPEELRKILEGDHLVLRVTPSGEPTVRPVQGQPLGRVLMELGRLGGFRVTADPTVPVNATVSVPASSPEDALRQVAAGLSARVVSETAPDGVVQFRLSRRPQSEEVDLDLSSSTTPAEKSFRLALAADRYGRPDAARKSFEHAKAAIRLRPEYKRELLVRLKNSDVAKQVASTVSEIIEKSENDQLTDAETEKYAQEFQKMLGEKRLTGNDLKDKGEPGAMPDAKKSAIGGGSMVSTVPAVPPPPDTTGQRFKLDLNIGVGSIKPGFQPGPSLDGDLLRNAVDLQTPYGGLRDAKSTIANWVRGLSGKVKNRLHSNHDYAYDYTRGSPAGYNPRASAPGVTTAQPSNSGSATTGSTAGSGPEIGGAELGRQLVEATAGSKPPADQLALLPPGTGASAGPTTAPVAGAAAMDRKYRELQQQVAALKTRVLVLKGRVGALSRAGAAAGSVVPAFVEDVRVEPALVAGGQRARIALVVRAARGARSIVSWRARAGRLSEAGDAGATWEAPAFPGAHEIAVELVMPGGERSSTTIELVVFEPGAITYAPQFLDARIAELEAALAALTSEHAALARELDAVLAKLTPDVAKSIEAMAVLTGRR